MCVRKRIVTNKPIIGGSTLHFLGLDPSAALSETSRSCLSHAWMGYGCTYVRMNGWMYLCMNVGMSNPTQVI